jgi:hypothetical protein
MASLPGKWCHMSFDTVFHQFIPGISPLVIPLTTGARCASTASGGRYAQENSMSLQAEIEDLKIRVARLEGSQRTNRGRTNMSGAAQYLGRSREWLRKLNLRGEGPRRGVDGSYSYDDLDVFIEGGDTAQSTASEN